MADGVLSLQFKRDFLLQVGGGCEVNGEPSCEPDCDFREDDEQPLQQLQHQSHLRLQRKRQTRTWRRDGVHRLRNIVEDLY